MVRPPSLLLLLALAAGCGPPSSSTRPTAVGDEDTTLGTGDVFDVRVYGEEELSASYRVAHDGSIDFPLIGRLQVVGLEPTAVAEIIADRLRSAEYLRHPQVSVFVQEYNSKRISVLGAVREPGSFPMQSGLTVVQAISLAGGFTALANRDGTTVARRIGSETRRFPVHVDRITSGQEEDFPIQAQDIIYVPERVF